MKKSKEQWVAYAQQRKRYYFFYENKVLDLTQLVRLHPGQKNGLANYFYKDITSVIFNIFPQNTRNLLNTLIQHVVGSIVEKKNDKKQSRDKSRTKTESSLQKKKKKVCFKKKCTVGDYEDSSNESDSSKFKIKKSILSNKSRPGTQIGCTDNRIKDTQNSKFSQRSINKRVQLSQNSIEVKPIVKPISAKQVNSKQLKLNQKELFNKIFMEELDEHKNELKIPILNVSQMLRSKE